MHFTYHDESEHQDRDRPALEIEITPEMIAAGAEELVFDSRLIASHVVDDVVRAVLEKGGYKVV